MAISMSLPPAFQLPDLTGYFTPVRRAARKFRGRELLDYYELLADQLEDSAGGSSILEVFQKDAERFRGTTRGVLSEYWAERYVEVGASMSLTWKGTLPDEDVAMVGAAEKGGHESMIKGLRDLARVGEVIRQAKRTFLATVAAAIVGTLVTMITLLAQPFFVAPFFRDLFGFIPAEFHGPMTRRYFTFAAVIGAVWLPLTVCVIGGGMWLKWAIVNWVGPRRAWADEKILIFRLYRDFRGSLFLAMLATLTQNRGGAVTNQREAMRLMREGATPWMAWKLDLILERLESTGASDASIFDVGVVDKPFYYLLEDVVEAKGLSAGLTRAGQRSEERAVKTISMRAKVLTWVSLAGSVGIAITLLGWEYAVIYEFRDSVTAYFNR